MQRKSFDRFVSFKINGKQQPTRHLNWQKSSSSPSRTGLFLHLLLPFGTLVAGLSPTTPAPAAPGAMQLQRGIIFDSRELLKRPAPKFLPLMRGGVGGNTMGKGLKCTKLTFCLPREGAFEGRPGDETLQESRRAQVDHPSQRGRVAR